MTKASRAVGPEVTDEANPGQEGSTTCETHWVGVIVALCAAWALRIARFRCVSVMRLISAALKKYRIKHSPKINILEIIKTWLLER